MRRRRPASSALLELLCCCLLRVGLIVSYLPPAFVGEFDAVVRDHLVDGAVGVAFALCVADDDDEAWFAHGDVGIDSRCAVL